MELGQTVSSLQALTVEGERALKENLFGLAAAKEKFQKFAATTEEARYQQLPFPIAVVQRKIRNAPNNTQKFSLLIELFEVVIRFIALVQLADYVNNRKQAAVVAEQVPDIKKLFAPALGDWVSIFKAFARIRLDKYQRTLQEFVDILVLDPYIVLERCPECHRPEVLLFDKLSDKKITYLAYDSGHRPALPNADRLPPIIREVATRRS